MESITIPLAAIYAAFRSYKASSSKIPINHDSNNGWGVLKVRSFQTGFNFNQKNLLETNHC